ncbi:MAG: hypothetical protein JNK64_38045 [Myxococcales bacterium]|nr:hypothetical protein [Myxococcales bacterium]
MKGAALAAALLGAAACGGASTAPAIGNQGGGAGALVGRYACQLTIAGWQYSLYACEIRSDHGRLVLEKLEGQMHVRGEVAPDGAGGFRWRGEVTCDWADGCRGEAAATFVALPGGIGWEGHAPPHATASGDTMGPIVMTIYTEAYVAGQGGERYGAWGAAGWNGGAYTGEVPVE